MAAKLRPLALPSQISTWVFSFKYISSVSSAISTQDCPEPYQKRPSSTEIDPRVQYLKNKLCPDELVRVLDRTHDLRSALKVFKWASLQRQFRHTCETYTTVILKLGLAGNVDEMEGFCREMVNDRCLGAEEALGHLLDVFVGKGRLDEAVRVLLVMNSCGFKVSVDKWNSVLGALVEGERDFRDVVLVYKEMVKSRTLPNVDTLNCLIKALFDADMGDKALDQFRRMERKRCAPNCRTFENVICGLVGLGRVEESVGVMNEMFERRVDPELRFYTRVIPLFCREDKLGVVKKLFGMMRSSELQPDSCIYECLIQLLCAHSHFGEATELFCEMRNIGFSPSADVINGVINAYCEMGNLEEARSLLEENSHGHLNNPTLYNKLLQHYCDDSDNLLSAKELFCKMLLSGLPDSLSWNVIIRANLKQAYKLLGKMIVSSYPPDDATYSSLVIGKCNLGKYEDAMKLFKQLSEKDWILDPNSYAKLIEGLCKVGKFQEAAEVFIYMSRRACPIRCSLFSGLIRGFCMAKRVDEAINLLRLGHSSKNPVDISIYTTIMDNLLKQDRPNDALVFFSQILRRGLVLDVEAYCILIQSMVATCQTELCVLLLNMMIVEGLIPNIKTFGSLFSYFASRSELHTIWMIIDKLSRESEAALGPEMYNVLIHVLWKEGYRTEASKLLDSMLDKGWVPDADTHALLIGSLHKEAREQISKQESLVLQDEVSCILSEGLGGK